MTNASTAQFAVGDTVEIVVHPTAGEPGDLWSGRPSGTRATVREMYNNGSYLGVTWADGTEDSSRWSPEWFRKVETITRFAIGDAIADSDDWNLLPMGAVCKDRDGWLHTKIADHDGNNGSGIPRSACVDERGVRVRGGFFNPWNWDIRVHSLPVSLEKNERPIIRFDDADVDRSTARSYAAALQSRVNKAQTNAILQDIADGKRVDAYRLLDVLPDIFSGCATRGAHSTARREHTKMARHLAYIANAVVQNHADDLPAYAEGQRSRKVEELQAALEESQRRAETAEGGIAALKVAANDQIDSMKAEIDSLRAEVRQAATTRDQFASALDYAMAMLCGAERQRVLGFLDGVQS